MSIQSFIHCIKARELLKTLGGKVAGGYLRNRGFSLEQALAALGLKQRFPAVSKG